MINRPYTDARGRFIHYCAVTGCNEWGAFGFPFNVWVCGAHRSMQAQLIKEAETRALKPAEEKQGRLL